MGNEAVGSLVAITVAEDPNIALTLKRLSLDNDNPT